MRCPACGLHRVSPRVRDGEVRRRLQEWAARDVADPMRLAEARSEGARRFFQAELDRIRRLLGGTGRLLDVGCGTGAFLEVARSRGFETAGVEMGIASSAWARNELRLQVQTGEFSEVQFTAESFDAVALYEVIEHLIDPLATLREVHRVLRPGGVLAVSTPNLGSLTARVLGRRWWPINCPDEHIHLFTAATLGDLLRRAGFSVASERTTGLDPFLWLRVLRGQEADWEAATRQRQALRAQVARRGGIGLARLAKRALDLPFAFPFSPLRRLGERLFVYGRRP